MATYKKFDPRVDSLVVETRTVWGDDLEGLSDADRDLVAQQLHAQAELATSVEYERAHTGFTRIITVHEDDIERLYNAQFAE